MTEQVQQRSAEWFEQRKNRITGSNIGAILGLSPLRKPKDVMRSMVRAHHGAESEFQGNIATEYGVRNESMAIIDFQFETGQIIDETGFHVHVDHDWLGASPDGFIGDDYVVEIKCPFGKRETGDFLPLHEQEHYFAQVQYEMYCTGRKKCHFFQWSDKSTMIETVEFDQEYIDKTLPKLEDFYNKFLDECKSPDKHLAPLMEHHEANSASERYQKAKELMDAAKLEMDAAKKEMLSVADGKKCTIGDFLVYPVKKQGSISYAKVVKDHCKDVDLEPYRGKATTSWVIK